MGGERGMGEEARQRERGHGERGGSERTREREKERQSVSNTVFISVCPGPQKHLNVDSRLAPRVLSPCK